MSGHPPGTAGSTTADSDQAGRVERTAAIRGGALRVIGYACGVLVSLGTATVLVRHLGIEGFGRYVTVTSLVALVGGVTEAGIVVHGIREFLLKADLDRRRLMGNLLAMRLTLAVVGVVLALCFAVAIGYGQAMVIGVLVAGTGLLVQVSSDVMSVPLQAELLLGRLTAVELARRTLALVLIAALALLGAGLVPLLAASALAGEAALAAIAWMVRARASLRPTFDLRAWRELLAETSLYAIALSIAAIYLYATVIVMSAIATPTQTGLFATSFRVITAGLAIPGLLLTAIFPLMTRGRREQPPDAGAGAIGKVLVVALICGVWMSLVTALAASSIIDVIAGSQGRGATPVLRIQGLMFTMSFVFTAGALYLISIRRYRPLVIASASALALNVILALVLVNELGAEGGAIADVVTEAVAAGGLTVVVLRSLRGHPLTLRFAGALGLACAASGATVLLPIGAIGRACAATIIYFSILLGTGTIPRELLEAARRLGRTRAAA